jgi:hypothetical protein
MDGANPVAGVMIRLGGALERTQLTNADGTYAFGSLPAGGTYTVTPSSTLYDFGTQSRTFNNLSGNETADFTAVVRRFRIAGQLKDANGGILSGAVVTLTVGGGANATAQTDTEGRYVFTDLPAVGSYVVVPFKADYTFTPSAARFQNLTADIGAADFTGRLSYRLGGQVLDASGTPLPDVRVALEWSANGTNFRVSGLTNSLGDWGFINLTPGVTYTVTPSSFAYSFAPASQTYDNISASHRFDFTGTLVVAAISGQVVDEGGKAVPGVTLRVSGAATSWGYTNNLGNYMVGGLRKGQTFTVTPVLLGYTFVPASKTIDLAGNATADFTARLLTPQAFTPGNVLVSANHVLTEYTPEGVQVQAVIVPQPSPNTTGEAHLTGDVVLDRNGDALVVNTKPLALASFSKARQSWQNVRLNESLNYHPPGGLATVENYAFIPSVDYSVQNSTSGLTRLNLDDNSINRFGVAAGYQDLTIGQDGLLYALLYNVSNDFARLHVYNPQTLQLVRERLVGIDTLAVTANSAGDLFLVNRRGVLARRKSDGTFVKQVNLGAFQLGDIDVSADGRIVVKAEGKIILLDEQLNVLSSFTPLNGDGYVAFTRPISVASIQFAATTFSAGEDAGQATVTVTRTGDLSGPASVEFSTTDDPAAVPCSTANGSAYARCDYATTIDTLRFAPGESQKTVLVPLIDDAYIEGAETAQVKLLKPAGALLGVQATATLTVNDNNDAGGAPNPIYVTPFFVRMQYLDFLSREPETGEPWSGVLNRCSDVNNNPACDRLIVSQSFFASPEFRLKGFYALNFYRVAFNRRPAYEEIIPDMRSVTGATPEEVYQKRAAFAVSFTSRSEFKGLYDALSDTTFVNNLLDRHELQSITTPDPANPEGGTKVVLTRVDLINRLSISNLLSLTRAQVLRAVVESDEVGAAEYNRSFVAMQYYGYLRRTPEEDGYQAWLRVINQDPNNIRVMVNGFMNSTEYKLRFGQP